MGQVNKINLQVIVHTDHINFNTFLAYLIQLKTDNKQKYKIDIKSVDNIDDILDIKHTGQTVLYLPRFCAFDVYRLFNLIEKKKPVYAAISTYWGVGHPYLAVFNNINLLKSSIKNVKTEHIDYFTDMEENIFFDVYKNISKLGKFSDILALSDEKLLTYERNTGIMRLDDFCNIESEGIKGTMMEQSIFGSSNDASINFGDFLSFFSDRSKTVYYNNTLHHCELGKSFFITPSLHFAKIKNEFVFWDGVQNEWLRADGHILEQINEFLQVNYN